MHVRRALAVTLAVPLLLAGCSEDEPEPKMPDSPPTSTSPTDEPTETETAEAESAEDFIRRWVKAGDQMQVTGETDEYDAMTPKCGPCQAFVENVREVYDNGGTAEFAGTTIVKLAREGDDPPTFALTKDVPKTVIRRGDGTSQTLLSGRTTLVVTLGRDRNDRLAVTHFVVRA